MRMAFAWIGHGTGIRFCPSFRSCAVLAWTPSTNPSGRHQILPSFKFVFCPCLKTKQIPPGRHQILSSFAFLFCPSLNTEHDRARKHLMHTTQPCAKMKQLLVARTCPYNISIYKGSEDTTKGIALHNSAAEQRKIFAYGIVALHKQATDLFWNYMQDVQYKPKLLMISLQRASHYIKKPKHHITAKDISRGYTKPRFCCFLSYLQLDLDSSNQINLFF